MTPHAHTPGPWIVIDNMLTERGDGVNPNLRQELCQQCLKLTGIEHPTTIDIYVKGWGVAQLASYHPVKEHDQHLANARLIAQAWVIPQLVDALKWIEHYTQEAHGLEPINEKAHAALRAVEEKKL